MNLFEQEQGRVEWTQEWKRPWKILSFSAGLGLMIVGALYYRIMDWDIPVSCIMCFLTYFTAPWCLHVILEKRWRLFPIMILLAWFTVDGSYSLYWYFRNPAALAAMRWENVKASMPLYFLCGGIWYYPGSLKQLMGEIRSMTGSKKGQ
jgi:hypothetical protein